MLTRCNNGRRPASWRAAIITTTTLQQQQQHQLEQQSRAVARKLSGAAVRKIFVVGS